MTVVCAVHHEGDGTWIGSDTYCTCGNGLIPSDVPKWFGAHGWAIGQSGDRFTHNLIDHEVDGLFHKCKDIFEASRRLIVLFDENKMNHNDEPGARSFNQELIICGPKNLKRPIWHIGPDMCFAPIPLGTLWAIGSGEEYARGAGYVADGGGRERVEAALAAAILYDQGCGGEPYVARLEDVSGISPDSE